MSLLFWKSNNEIDRFANDLATEFYSNVDSRTVAGLVRETSGRKPSKEHKKSNRMLEKEYAALVDKIKRFKAEERLGVYGKARLHMKFKYRLMELGYDEDVVDLINEFIMKNTP